MTTEEVVRNTPGNAYNEIVKILGSIPVLGENPYVFLALPPQAEAPAAFWYIDVDMYSDSIAGNTIQTRFAYRCIFQVTAGEALMQVEAAVRRVVWSVVGAINRDRTLNGTSLDTSFLAERPTTQVIPLDEGLQYVQSIVTPVCLFISTAGATLGGDVPVVPSGTERVEGFLSGNEGWLSDHQGMSVQRA